jgi:ankyrin repeat protein
MLIDARADVDQCDYMKHTPLMMCEDVDIARKLVVNGADVNATDARRLSVLYHACNEKNEEVARLLIDYGANAAHLLYFSCSRKRYDILSFLLKFADESSTWINATIGSSNETALILSSQKKAMTEYVKILINAGANLFIKDEHGFTALHHAENVEVAQILLNAGAGSLLNDPSIMFKACQGNRIDVVKFFLEQKCDINSVDDIYTPLNLAVGSSDREGHHRCIPMVRFLLSADPPPDVNLLLKDEFVFLPLSVVAMDDNIQVVKILMEAGANCGLRDLDGCCPLNETKSREMVRLMIEHDPESVNSRCPRGRSVFMDMCVHTKQFECLDELFTTCAQHNMAVDVNSRDLCGDTGLHLAMVTANAEAVYLLLSKQADVLGSGFEDTTVLMKPFIDDEMLSRLFGAMLYREGARTFTTSDERINSCLQMVLDAICNADV